MTKAEKERLVKLWHVVLDTLDRSNEAFAAYRAAKHEIMGVEK